MALSNSSVEVIMAENFLELMTDIRPQIQETQGTPSRINSRKTTARHIIFKLLRTKEKRENLENNRKTIPFLNRNKAMKCIHMKQYEQGSEVS